MKRLNKVFKRLIASKEKPPTELLNFKGKIVDNDSVNKLTSEILNTSQWYITNIRLLPNQNDTANEWYCNADFITDKVIR